MRLRVNGVGGHVEGSTFFRIAWRSIAQHGVARRPCIAWRGYTILYNSTYDDGWTQKSTLR